MPKGDNLPPTVIDSLPTETVTEIISSLDQLAAMPKPLTDDDYEQRISQYFDICRQSSMRPCIQGLALALGTNRMSLSNWARGVGCSHRRAQIIQDAKQYIYAFLEIATYSGKVNPAVGIFLSKNWLKYQDSVAVQVEPIQPYKPELTPDEIVQKLTEDLPIDDITAED